MIINLEDVKSEKRFKKRYETRRYLIRTMIMYEGKFTLDELVYDFNGIFKVMQEKGDNVKC